MAGSLEQEGTGEIASVTQGTSNCYLVFLRPLPGDLVLRWAGEVGSWEASRYLGVVGKVPDHLLVCLF